MVTSLRPRCGLGLLAGLLCAGGCRPNAASAPAQPAAEAPAPQVERRARPLAPAQPVQPATAPAQVLPEGTGMVVTVASVQHLLRVVDLPALIARYRPYYDQASAGVEGVVGVNLLDPGRWAEIGVDAEGPLGMALLDTDAEVVCVFFTLRDPVRFRDFLDGLGRKLGGELAPLYEDRGVVLGSERSQGSALVVRDGFAFAVFVGRPQRAPYDYARAIATVDPTRGLAGSTRWQQALGPAPPRDLVAFVDIGGMMRAELEAQLRRSEQGELDWAEHELARLREQGAPAEEIARWEQIAIQNRQAEAVRRAQQRRSQEFMREVFGPLGPLVFEFSLGPKEVTGTIRAQAPETALVREIVRAGEGPPLALRAAGERVIFGAGGSVEVAAALRGLDALLQASGGGLEQASAGLERALDVRVKELSDLVDGTASFALTLRDPKALSTAEPDRAIGVAMTLGVKDPAAAQALLRRVEGRLRPMLKLKHDARTRGFSAEVPGWRTLHAAVAGRTLTVSTDPQFAGRVERGAVGAPDRWIPTPTVPVVTAQGIAGAVMVDFLMPMGWMVARSHRDYAYDPSRQQPYWRFPDASHDRVDAAPQSAAYKAKLREWKALDARARKVEAERERRSTATMVQVSQALGSWAMNLRETEGGLVAEGGQYFGPGGLARAIELAIEGYQSRDVAASAELHDRRIRVEQELQELRVRDVERALGVPAAGSP